MIRFHLHPEVKASVSRDGHSVLLRGPSNRGWRLRNDAQEAALEPSVHFDKGQPRRASQVVLRGQFHADQGGRIRWKLAPAEEDVREARAEAAVAQPKTDDLEGL